MGAFSIMGNRAIGKAQNKHNQMQSQISRHYHTQTHAFTYSPNHTHTVTTKTLTQQQLSWNLILEGNEPGRNKSQNPWGKAVMRGNQTGGSTQYCACSCLMCLLVMCPAMLASLPSLLSSCLWPTNCVACATANKVHTPVWGGPLQHLLLSSPFLLLHCHFTYLNNTRRRWYLLVLPSRHAVSIEGQMLVLCYIIVEVLLSKAIKLFPSKAQDVAHGKGVEH